MNALAEVQTDNRIILHREQGKIDEFTQGVQEYADMVNTILTSFNSLNLGALTMEDIHQLAKGSTTIKTIAQDRMVGDKAVKVGGLNLNLTQVKEMVQLPDLEEVEGDVAILKYRIDLDRKRGGYQRKPGLKDVAIVDGVAMFNPMLLSAFVDSYTAYARTDDEKEAHHMVLQVKELVQEIHDRFGIRLLSNDAGPIFQHGTGSYGTAPYKTALNGQLLRRRMDEAGKY